MGVTITAFKCKCLHRHTAPAPDVRLEWGRKWRNQPNICPSVLETLRCKGKWNVICGVQSLYFLTSFSLFLSLNSLSTKPQVLRRLYAHLFRTGQQPLGITVGPSALSPWSNCLWKSQWKYVYIQSSAPTTLPTTSNRTHKGRLVEKCEELGSGLQNSSGSKCTPRWPRDG